MSNDNAMNAAAAVALALLLRVLDDDRPPRRRDTAALAIAVGVAPLAKITGVSLAAFVVATLLWTAWRRRAAGANDRRGGSSGRPRPSSPPAPRCRAGGTCATSGCTAR
ncbi:MAG: hypothetical protein U0470_07560 [Anaerolineae bacterium]